LVSIDLDRQQLEYLYKSANIENIIKKLFERVDKISLSINNNILTVTKKKNFLIVFINNFEYQIDINNIKYEVSQTSSDYIVGFIGSIRDSQAAMKESFIILQRQDKEEKLYSFLKKIDSNIENVKLIGGERIECKVKNHNGDFIYRDLNEFGDGLRQYISIIIDLYAVGNGFLFIDEVDNGIHYSVLEDLWEIIFSISKEMNVQIFATTHSLECIQAYCRVAERLNDQDISFTTLVKNKDNQIKAIVQDYSAFTDSIHQGNEVRGW
jgi:AAA15 family ATPase/GTPase